MAALARGRGRLHGSGGGYMAASATWRRLLHGGTVGYKAAPSATPKETI